MQKAKLSVRLWNRLIKIRLCSSSLYACTLQVHYSLECIVECWLHLDLPNCETTCAAPQWRLRRLQHMESETLMHLSVYCIAVLQCRVHLEMSGGRQWLLTSANWSPLWAHTHHQKLRQSTSSRSWIPDGHFKHKTSEDSVNWVHEHLYESL